MMRTILPVVLLLGACATSRGPSAGAFTPEFQAPTHYETDRVHLEPLSPRHAQLDYDAWMGSREHLQRTLHWGSWPSAEMTVEENRSDLARHAAQFDAHEAYAYTVLTPDRSKCVGCVYIDPVEDDPRGASLAYWVVEPELASDLDRHLVQSVLEMVNARFPIDRIDVLVHKEDARDAAILTDLGLTEEPSPSPDHRLFVWHRA